MPTKRSRRRYARQSRSRRSALYCGLASAGALLEGVVPSNAPTSLRRIPGVTAETMLTLNAGALAAPLIR